MVKKDSKKQTIKAGSNNIQVQAHQIVLLTGLKGKSKEEILNGLDGITNEVSTLTADSKQEIAVQLFVEKLDKLNSKNLISENNGSEKTQFLLESINEVLKSKDLDEEQYKSLIDMYVGLSMKDFESIEVIETRKIWNTVRNLSSVDLLVIKTNYNLLKELGNQKDLKYENENQWRQMIANSTGISLIEVIIDSENNLKNRQILESSAGPATYRTFRFTGLGMRIGEILDRAKVV